MYDAKQASHDSRTESSVDRSLCEQTNYINAQCRPAECVNKTLVELGRKHTQKRRVCDQKHKNRDMEAAGGIIN